MIFYGTRASNLHNGKINHVTCPNCEKETSMTYSVFGKYAHVYWIPFFPYSKVSITECDSCKRTFEATELPDSIRQKLKVENERHSIKYPIWFFSGLFIIAALVAIGIYMSGETEKKEKAYLESPQLDDKYEYKTESGYYSIMKISKVTPDSVYFYINDMETNKTSGIYDIDKEKNYSMIEGYTREEVKQLYTDKVVYEINRD